MPQPKLVASSFSEDCSHHRRNHFGSSNPERRLLEQIMLQITISQVTVEPHSVVVQVGRTAWNIA
jgi:hypothetical protein